MMVVAVDPGPKLNVGRPTELFEGTYRRSPARNNPPNYDVSLDGKRFLMVTGTATDEDATSAQLIVVLHWFDELQRLVPSL